MEVKASFLQAVVRTWLFLIIFRLGEVDFVQFFLCLPQLFCWRQSVEAIPMRNVGKSKLAIGNVYA